MSGRSSAGQTRTAQVAEAISDEDRDQRLGETIRVSEGRLVNAEGRLAGAHLDMNAAILNAHRHGGATLAEALAMASTAPAAYLGLSGSHGRIAPGRKAIFSVLRTAALSSA